jgi:hypothetical protein
MDQLIAKVKIDLKFSPSLISNQKLLAFEIFLPPARKNEVFCYVKIVVNTCRKA